VMSPWGFVRRHGGSRSDEGYARAPPG
jgi:hypothetical protein